MSKCSIVFKWNASGHSINRMLDALSGCKQLRHGLGGQCLCEVARSLGNTLNIWLWWHDLSPPNFLRHNLWLYYSFLSMISYFHRNSVVRLPKLTCIELLISLHNDRHLFADCFVTAGPIVMKFGWGLENVSSLKFRKFHLNQSNFTRKLTLMFKLDLKKCTLTAFRHPV